MKIIVTGGAGFIGSNIVGYLNENNITDIIIVDNINTTNKWLNISNKKYIEYIHKKDFLNRIEEFSDFNYIIHLGACSSTTEEDFDYLYDNNYNYSKTIFNFCEKNNINLIYASSAATYGNDKLFDDKCDIDDLLPLNRYGYSKEIFDQWINKQNDKPKQCVGLKFFNVYGPNEYAKGNMASMVFHGYNQIKSSNKMKLFKSYDKSYKDGEQLRDFIYVKDICKVIKFFVDNPDKSGLFNLGTGKARSFNDLARSIFDTLNLDSNIEYIGMPEKLINQYQYFTQANMEKLRNIGYNDNMYSLEEGIKDYVIEYLEKDYKIR